MPTAFRRVPIGVPTIDLVAGGNRNVEPWKPWPLPGLEMRRFEWPRPPLGMHQKVAVTFGAVGEGEECRVKLDARKYDPALLREFMDGFAAYAAGLCERPDAPILR